MASSLSRRSSTSSGPVLSSYSSTGFASASSRFSSPSTAAAASMVRNSSSCFDHNNHRSASPTRVNLYNFSSGLSSSSTKISNSGKSSRSVAVNSACQHQNRVPSSTNQPKRTCMCSPTNHPGSFRCSLHKSINNNSSSANNYQSNNQRLSARRSAMTNSLVRISTVEGDLVKRALASLIRPSSHNQRRRSGFQPRPSRLSVMSR
ncbi:hypothetical protein C5167_013610 [Papaver somniferum]|uniref:Serine-rich protein-like protein n=1 Tax=Papaver somniferum TaxID=3469 RepID=A0A4Y7J2T4_PAPSO|nr:uncharacterized protein LOC113361436 [Papaver somniferum]RZC54756.1 hypothetical protein C5167_013610 [Papaver somniferum]